MALRINDEAPNFTTETTQGTIDFHEWIGSGWAILFSHPKDFTPVCTTELGYMAGLQPEFAMRNTKIIATLGPASSSEAVIRDLIAAGPLPYRDAGGLVMVWEQNTRQVGEDHNVVSPGNYLDWKRQAASFEAMGLFAASRFVLSGLGEAEVVIAFTETARGWFRVTVLEDLRNNRIESVVLRGDEVLGGGWIAEAL